MAGGITKQLHDLAIQKSHFVEMMFYPDAWLNAKNSSRVWTELTFPPHKRSDVEKSAGVYAFVVTPGIFDIDSASGLFYVGKATNLYERIGSYIGEIGKDLKSTKRPHVWRMLNQWNGHLRYHFTITKDVAEAEALEEEMLKAFRPPFNKQYDAETSRVMRAFK